jgi:hypothetical protein
MKHKERKRKVGEKRARATQAKQHGDHLLPARGFIPILARKACLARRNLSFCRSRACGNRRVSQRGAVTTRFGFGTDASVKMPRHVHVAGLCVHDRKS